MKVPIMTVASTHRCPGALWPSLKDLTSHTLFWTAVVTTMATPETASIAGGGGWTRTTGGIAYTVWPHKTVLVITALAEVRRATRADFTHAREVLPLRVCLALPQLPKAA